MKLIQDLNLSKEETKKVFTLSCAVLKKMLFKEQLKSNNPVCDIKKILQHTIFQKSIVVFATELHLFQSSQNI